MDPVSTINEQNEKTERQAMEGLEDVNRESQKTARDIGKRFSGSIAGLGKDMLRAIKRSRDESIERRKAQKAQRKAYSSGMLGVAANQITKGANATAGAVKG